MVFIGKCNRSYAMSQWTFSKQFLMDINYSSCQLFEFQNSSKRQSIFLKRQQIVLFKGCFSCKDSIKKINKNLTYQQTAVI